MSQVGQGARYGVKAEASLDPGRGGEQSVEVARIVQRQSPELIPLRRHVAMVLAARLIRRRKWMPYITPTG